MKLLHSYWPFALEGDQVELIGQPFIDTINDYGVLYETEVQMIKVRGTEVKVKLSDIE